MARARSPRGRRRDAALSRAVRAGARRPALVPRGHSKGPIDAHAALVLHPEICPHVRALISLQAPFAGTPLATDPSASRPLRRLTDAAIRLLLQGSPRAFWDERRYGAASDGFVAAVDGAIPGSRLVRLERMDHAGLALR